MRKTDPLQGRALACLVALAVLWACSGSVEQGSPASSDRKESSEGPGFLLYQRGLKLHRLNLSNGTDEMIGNLPAAEVHASPSSSWLAVVVAPGQTDFAAHPRLSLMQPEAGHRRSFGPGLAPLWRPDGKALAYLRPVEQRRCEGESCLGRVEVVIASLSGATETVLGPARWTLLSWAGSRLLLGRLGDRREVTLVGPGDPPQRLPVAPGELWGASPDGRWVILARRRGAVYVALTPSGRLGRPRELVAAGRLAEGSWSPDSTTVAGVLLEGGNRSAPRTGVVISSPLAGERRRLPGSRGVAGAPMWSPDGRSIVFPQAAGAARGRLRAQVCDLEGGGCRSWLRWTDEVRLLRLE